MHALSLTALLHSLDIGNGVCIVSAEHLLLPIGQELLSFGLIHALHVILVGSQVLIHNDLLVEIWLLAVLHLYCLLVHVAVVISVVFSLATSLSRVDIAEALSGVHKDLLLVTHLSVLLLAHMCFFLVLNLELLLAGCIHVLDAFDDLNATLAVVDFFTALARVPRASILTIIDDFNFI